MIVFRILFSFIFLFIFLLIFAVFFGFIIIGVDFVLGNRIKKKYKLNDNAFIMLLQLIFGKKRGNKISSKISETYKKFKDKQKEKKIADDNKVCINCNNKLKSNAKFCNKCGTEI